MSRQNHNGVSRVARWRWLVLAISVVLLASADVHLVRRTDAVPARGAGYAHHSAEPCLTVDPDYSVLFGAHRVRFNFRHFAVWWINWPAGVGTDLRAILSSDGNHLSQNLVGHLIGSMILVLLALWLVPRPLFIAALGTLINVFHEYVAEGWYADPSFVDLWLDQLGLVLALILWIGLRFLRLRRQPA